MTEQFVPLRERDTEDAPRNGTASAEDKLTEDQPIIKPDGTPTAKGWRKIGEQFRKAMPAKQFTAGKRGTFSYVTARQVQDRLDAVVGPGNWGTQVHVVRPDHPVAVLVGVSVFGVWKFDAGYSNNPDAGPDDRAFEDEPLKAAVSDGFKRAAVQWGIGRFLYGDT